MCKATWEVKRDSYRVSIVCQQKRGKRFPKTRGRNPMKNNIPDSKKVQQQIEQYTHRITEGLNKRKKKFIGQVLFGIQAARDIKLSNIARSLKEDIRLIKTENRLSRQLQSEDLTQRINSVLIADSQWRIKDDTVLALDLSDVHKPFAKKMEGLAKVWDGSKGEPADGYWLCEVIAAQVDKEALVPLYSELYSHKVAGFESENEQILKAIRMVSAKTKGRGIWAMDRGCDRHILVEELGRLKQSFVIRLRGDRHFTDPYGHERKIPNLVRSIKYTEHYQISIDREGCQENVRVQLGTKENLFIEGVEVRLIVIKGFGREPMLLMSNVDKSARQILEIYLTRWKCEEAFRFLKHEYHLEDVRVRRYQSIRNTVALLHAVFYFVSVCLGQRLRMSILLRKIIERSKRFFEVPVFKHYAVADGIYRLLFNMRWEEHEPNIDKEQSKQLSFGFG